MENVENQELNQVGQQATVPVEPTINEEKPKRSKKRLFLLLFLLVMTAIMLTTSTYAWFTSNRTVTVEDINVNVAASGGIQISVDGSAWKTIITNADLLGAHSTYAAATNQIPSTLRPVSTAGQSLDSNGYMSMWLGTVSTSNSEANRGEYILSTEDVSTVVDSSVADPGQNAGKNGAFVMFDLFVRLDDSTSTADKMLYLTTSSNVVVQDNKADLGTQNSARVAFIKENHIATGSALSDIQALKSTNASDIHIWEPNYNTHTPTGLSNAYSYYNNANSGSQHAAAQAGTQITYHGVIGAVSTSDDVLLSKANATDNSSKFATVTAPIKTAANWSSGTTYEQLFALKPNYITKIRVYFWIEGQDIDCENSASGGQIALRLQFSLDSSSPATSGTTSETTSEVSGG